MSAAVDRTGAATAPALAVGPGELHIWVLPRPWTHTDPAPLPVGELDERERDRAAGLVRTGDRVRYLSAHVALRRLLSAYTGIPPGALRLGRDRCPCRGGPHGRPVLLDLLRGRCRTGRSSRCRTATRWPSWRWPEPEPSSASASTPTYSACRPPARSVRLCLPDRHPAEQAELAAVPGGRRPAAFARLWTRKEAYLKGLGTGLRRAPAADHLGDHRDAPARPPGWSVTDLPGPPGHAAAAAVRGRDHHRTVVRTLTADCLHAEDATELIAAARPRVHRVPQAAAAGGHWSDRDEPEQGRVERNAGRKVSR